VHLLFSGIIAAVLLSLASILRSKALIALGTGFFFVGLIAIAHALSYPEAFSRSGLLGAHITTATWLYLAWHTVLPGAIIAYAVFRHSPYRLDNPVRAPVRTIFVCLMAAAMAAAAIIWLTTGGIVVLTDVLQLGMRQANVISYLAMLLIAAGIVLLWLGQRSILDLGLILTLWALLTESVMILPGADRFSAGWYAGRVMGLLSGLFVLLMLMIEMTRLYARTVVLIASQKGERENRLMLGEAIGAFVAHELCQPLAAMMLNAHTAKQLGAQDHGQLSAVLDDLIEDSCYVQKIVESTRAAFGRNPAQKSRSDINQLVRDALRLVSGELGSRNIKADLHLDDHLPPVVVNYFQMQRVFVNLFVNATEAMREITGRPHRLTVHSSRTELGIVVRVADTGPGIAAEDQKRIFDAFFTTKEHGIGMGLSICSSIVAAHEGTIQVSPGIPFGTVFEICLPAEGVVQASPVSPADPPAFRPITNQGPKLW